MVDRKHILPQLFLIAVWLPAAQIATASDVTVSDVTTSGLTTSGLTTSGFTTSGFTVSGLATPGLTASVQSTDAGSAYVSESASDTIVNAIGAVRTEMNRPGDHNGSGGDYLLGPFTRPEWNYLQARYERGYLHNSGLLFGTSAVGMEYNYRLQYSPWYIGMQTGYVNRLDRRMPDVDYALLGSVMVGRETLLNTIGRDDGISNRRIIQGVIIYSRFGVGPGVMTTGTSDGGAMQMHFGFNMLAAAGAMVLTSSRFTPFMEMGGTTRWHPTHSDLEWLIGPHLTVGLRIFLPPPIPMYRY